MVLIFGSKLDHNNKYLIEWLKYFKTDYLLISKGNEEINIVNIDLDKNEYCLHFTKSNKIVSSKDIKSVWFRGGKIQLSDFVYSPDAIRNQKTFSDKVLSFMSMYSVSKHEFIKENLCSLNQFGEDGKGRFNKLLALQAAKKNGIKIPQTIVSTKKEDIITFKKKNDRIITKSLDNNLDFHTEDGCWYHQYTNEVLLEHIDSFPEKFPLTIFQKMIQKKYEVRTFIINNKMYSGALYSQKTSKTSIDYRRYDYSRMNRQVPFSFPKDFRDKILCLMNSLNLRTGSLDFIRGADNEFYFLEINPIGQFGHLSSVCNHFLYREIAKELV